MKNTAIYYSILAHMISKHNLGRMARMNRDRVGFHEAKGYSNRKNFKRNQRKGL